MLLYTIRSLLGIQHRDVGEIAVQLFVIQAAAYDKAVRDFEAAEFDGHLDNAAHGTVEEGADAERTLATAG